jgi:hypothetical protein
MRKRLPALPIILQGKPRAGSLDSLRAHQGPSTCATAVSELLYPEATRLSGLFLQKKATFADSGNGYVNSETALAPACRIFSSSGRATRGGRMENRTRLPRPAPGDRIHKSSTCSAFTPSNATCFLVFRPIRGTVANVSCLPARAPAAESLAARPCMEPRLQGKTRSRVMRMCE